MNLCTPQHYPFHKYNNISSINNSKELVNNLLNFYKIKDVNFLSVNDLEILKTPQTLKNFKNIKLAKIKTCNLIVLLKDCNYRNDNSTLVINEIKILYFLKNFKKVVYFFDLLYDQNKDILYLVTEYIPCENVYNEYIFYKFPIQTLVEEITMLKIFKKCCKCVKILHDNDIIHCDIKPDNFIYFNNKIKILDFGSSIFKGQHTTIKRGTIGFIPPEFSQITNNSSLIYDETFDIWSLGIMLYELLTKKLYHPSDILSQYNISDNCFQLISKMLQIDKHKRFQNIDDILDSFPNLY